MLKADKVWSYKSCGFPPIPPCMMKCFYRCCGGQNHLRGCGRGYNIRGCMEPAMREGTTQSSIKDFRSVYLKLIKLIILSFSLRWGCSSGPESSAVVLNSHNGCCGDLTESESETAARQTKPRRTYRHSVHLGPGIMFKNLFYLLKMHYQSWACAIFFTLRRF